MASYRVPRGNMSSWCRIDVESEEVPEIFSTQRRIFPKNLIMTGNESSAHANAAKYSVSHPSHFRLRHTSDPTTRQQPSTSTQYDPATYNEPVASHPLDKTYYDNP